jgi:membrane protein required for colicin V production
MISSFTVIDWLVVIVVLISVIFAAMKGFVRELIGLGSIVLAFLLASWFYTSVAEPLKGVVKTENLALFCGFSIVFLGTLIAGILVAWLVSTFMKFARLQWFDRCLGALFGLVRGWLLGGIIFVGLTTFNIQVSSVRNSELAPYFLPASRMFALVTPSEFKVRFRSGYEAIERWWKEQR